LQSGFFYNFPVEVEVYGKFISYIIKVSRTITSDLEKVIILRHQLITAKDNEMEIIGVIKNVSDIKTDAALVATFYNQKMRI
jgi:hypothetical protein